MTAKTPEKACCDCGQTKPLAEFFRDSKRKDGATPWCKACNTIRTKTAKARREGTFVPPAAEPAPLTTRQQVVRLKAKAIEGAAITTAKTTRKPRTAEQKAKDAEGARRRRAAENRA